MSDRNPGHFLREWRQSMKMTQKEFADYVGLSMSNYNYLEAGKIGYTQKSLETIARKLEVTPAELLSVNPLEQQVSRDVDNWDEFYDSYQSLSPGHQQLVNQIAAMFRTYEQQKILARMRLSVTEAKDGS